MKRLLGLLIVLSLGVGVYETLDITWRYNAVDDTVDQRGHETTKLFHLRVQEDEKDRDDVDGTRAQSSASTQINSSSAGQESSGNEEISHSNADERSAEAEQDIAEVLSDSPSGKEVGKSISDSEETMDFEEVDSADLLHMSLLQEICLDSQDAIIPWQYGAPRNASDQDTTDDRRLLVRRSDLNLIEALKDCPDVDVFVPGGLRSHGYCEDGAAYTKYLKSRMLPKWVFTDVFYDATGRSLTYNEICPNTPIIYFNHYWDGVHELSKDKPLYLMPNIEMYELRETHLWRADVVLCKTMSCQNRVTQWYKQEGNPRNTQVFYTKHTTSDVARFARHRLLRSNESATMKAKDFENVRFVHTAGSSSWKGTKEILQCWLSRTDLPPLDLHIGSDNFRSMFDTHFVLMIQRNSNIRLVVDNLDAMHFGRVMAESAFFLCPSRMEGYGHYINQARAAGGVIITTQAEPMNELVPSTDMGVYVETSVDYDKRTFLGGAFNGPHGLRGVKGLIANTEAEHICAAVDSVVATSEQEREAKATRIQQQYHMDTKFFRDAMERLRAFARHTI